MIVAIVLNSDKNYFTVLDARPVSFFSCFVA